MVISTTLLGWHYTSANPICQHRGLTNTTRSSGGTLLSYNSSSASTVVLEREVVSSQIAHLVFLDTLSTSTRPRLRPQIAITCSRRSSIASSRCGSTGRSRGSFPARFLRCESTSHSRARGHLGMTSTTTTSSPALSDSDVALIHGSKQSSKRSLVKHQNSNNNGVALVKKLSTGAKEVVSIATLPEEIPLENLKIVLPSTAFGDSFCSSDDDEVERRQQNGSSYRNGHGNNVNGSAAGARVAAAQAQDSDTLVLGKDFHELSLAITEPDMDDEVTGDKEAYMAGVLARYRKTLVERTKYHLGYPYNLDFNYQALSQLQHFSINNLGDPFIESNYGVHSRQFEVGVLDWFARLWDIEKEQYWGYITNCGTEGNLHGILVGREVFPDGILYASKDSHYSVFKAARMYRMEVVKVDTLLSGEIDCNDLTRKLANRADKPAILNVNIGTTVKGAVDDLDGVLESLNQAGFSEDRFYIHCDGALFGLMMPFVTKAPRVTFKKPIGSVSVSGHKFIGCPMPCGIQITRIEYIEYLSRNVEYLASRDATIMGSRNGHAPLFLWYTLNRKGYRGFHKEVQRCLRNAYYLKDRLRDAGFGVMLNELSSTVVFERPQDENFIRKWQLACQGSIAHAVVMPSVTVEKLDRFLSELIESRAKFFPDGKEVVPCIVDEVGPENCACRLHLNLTPVTRVFRQTSWGSNGYHA